jgi:DNA processing protein
MEQSRLMNKGTIYTIHSKAYDFPERLRSIPDPPAQLYVISDDWADLLQRPWVAIVGSRKVTGYGKAVTATVAGELAREGVVVVSGLAIGVDGVAHRTALEAGGLTVAVLAGGLDHIHPASHGQLARQIIKQGGAVVSEYPVGIPSYRDHFIARNRIVSGLSQVLVITEAGPKSGTLHTARFALEQGRDVFAVPGNITSPASATTNSLIKSGANLVTGSADILLALGISSRCKQGRTPKGDSAAEQLILDMLVAGEQEGSKLLSQSKLDVRTFNQTLTMLEITGKIRALGADTWTLS